MLTAFLSYLLREIINLTIKTIRHGVEDEKIIADYQKSTESSWVDIASTVFSLVLCGFLIISFAFSIWLHFSEDTLNTHSSLKVIASSSMSTKHGKNEYLFKNNLNDQLDTFDLIITEPLPGEFELELYDIVVYEYEDIHIIHRIVGIEEPNNRHPGHRLFVFQGDAISQPDRDYVTYDQMKSIYSGRKIPFIGSFVFFMKSPAGWLCILLILFTIIATPIVEKSIYRETMFRLNVIGYISDEELEELKKDRHKWGKERKKKKRVRDKVC